MDTEYDTFGHPEKIFTFDKLESGYADIILKITAKETDDPSKNDYAKAYQFPGYGSDRDIDSREFTCSIENGVLTDTLNSIIDLPTNVLDNNAEAVR